MTLAKAAGLGLALMLSSCMQDELDVQIADNANSKVNIWGQNLNDNSWAYYTVDLGKYANQTVTINFSVKMTVNNMSGKAANLLWQVTTDGYPIVAEQWVETGQHTYTVKGTKEVKLGSGPVFYLSTGGITAKWTNVTLENMVLDVTPKSSTSANNNGETSWTSVSALKSVLGKYFDRFGMECNESQIKDSKVQAGLKHHANSITMENEFKPDFIFNWATPNQNGTFTSSKGVTIKVPTNTPSWTRPDALMTQCKNLGIQMRGHVLVWHSQTPSWFFRQNYSNNGALVSAREMEARQEWYIKTVLEHVKWWENTYNGGKRIIYAWDVVNEAVADDASGNNWLRGSTSGTAGKAPAQGGSYWYQIYRNSDFIVNAFRYANKYAPKDVELCYNDYNCYMDNKTDGILKLISAVQAARWDGSLPTRLDAIGMQSHVTMTWPTASGYANAVKKFVAKGINVQVTELDVAHGTSAYNPTDMQKRYKELFQVFIANRKTGSAKGVEGVTVWGVNDEDSWLQSSNSTTQYPLPFKKGSNGNYIVKAPYYGILEAAN